MTTHLKSSFISFFCSFFSVPLFPGLLMFTVHCITIKPCLLLFPITDNQYSSPPFAACPATFPVHSSLFPRHFSPLPLCAKRCALCPLPFVLCLLSSALCPPPSVLCPLSSVLRPLSPVLCPLSSVFCPRPLESSLNTGYYSPANVY